MLLCLTDLINKNNNKKEKNLPVPPWCCRPFLAMAAHGIHGNKKITWQSWGGHWHKERIATLILFNPWEQSPEMGAQYSPKHCCSTINLLGKLIRSLRPHHRHRYWFSIQEVTIHASQLEQKHFYVKFAHFPLVSMGFFFQLFWFLACWGWFKTVN